MKNIKLILIIILTTVIMFTIIRNLFFKNSQNDLKTLVSQGAFLVDVRTAEEFNSGSVKGATNIPLDKIETRISDFKNKTHIIVFCRSGNRSGLAKSKLSKHGINNVTNGGTWKNVEQFVIKN